MISGYIKQKVAAKLWRNLYKSIHNLPPIYKKLFSNISFYFLVFLMYLFYNFVVYKN